MDKFLGLVLGLIFIVIAALMTFVPWDYAIPVFFLAAGIGIVIWWFLSKKYK
ncbi:MAG: hypothetical protein ABSG90_02755 [Dehalococcoidia bacterium]|jgi:membrane protein implicated in regulation of membrane protease activity